MAGRDWSDLVFGQAPGVETVQTKPSRDWGDVVLGDAAAPAPATKSGPASAPFPGYKAPKNEGWAEWIGRNISGRQDPRYKGLPSLEQELLKEGSESHLKGMRAATPFVTSDTGLANIAAKGLGDRFVKQEMDGYGYPVITFKGKDGAEKAAYLNRPGLDLEDVGRGVMQAIPYIATGGTAGTLMKGAGVGLNAAMQAGAGASTSVLTDITGTLMGSGEGVDTGKASIVGGVSGAVPIAGAALAPFVRRFWTVPGLFDRSTGALTPKGEAAAKAAGVEPTTLTSELSKQFANEYAKSGSTRIGASMASREFDIRQSLGQSTKDPGQLLTEKGMRTGAYGETAKDTMRTFDRTQAGQIDAAARGGAEAKRSVAFTLNPNTPGRGPTQRNLGESVRGAVSEAEQAGSAEASAAWKNVGKIAATPETLKDIPAFIGPKLGELPVDKTLTKSAAGMLDDLRAFMKGELPSEYADVIGKAAVPDVVQMRRRLFAQMRTAENETDKAAARAIYGGFGEWIEQSAAVAASNGNPMQAAALRVATDKTRELKAIFGEAGASGSSPGRKIVHDILDPLAEATPERIISRLFTVDTGAAPKAGSVEALRLIKQGFQKYMPPDRAEAAVADLKLAWWKRTIETPSGELHTPAMMAKRIDQAMTSQSSVVNELLTTEQKALVQRFAVGMKDIAWKDPNPSGTATGNQFYASQFGQSLFRMLGEPNGPIGRVLSAFMRSTPVLNAMGATAAQRAINPRFAPSVPSSVPAASAGYATRQWQEDR